MICQQCGQCCKNHPCAPLPSEIDRIAAYLKISTDEFVKKYLIWDFWTDESKQDEFHWYKVFRRITDSEEKEKCEFTWPFGNEPCILLDENNQCKIHPVKPLQASETNCEEQSHNVTKEGLCKAWEQTKYFQEWTRDH